MVVSHSLLVPRKLFLTKIDFVFVIIVADDDDDDDDDDYDDVEFSAIFAFMRGRQEYNKIGLNDGDIITSGTGRRTVAIVSWSHALH